MSANRSRQSQLIESGPAVARLAVGVWWRAARWGLSSSARQGVRMGRVAADPVLATGVVLEIGAELRDYARDLLGITELEARVSQLGAPPPEATSSNGRDNGAAAEAVALRVKGALLLKAAAEVGASDHAHPAYARILTELAPDEGRILRLLATEGPQPSVDVRATNLIGVGSELVAFGLNMVGAQAGLQHRERVTAYLNNLERLGLIWFSRERIDDAVAYQVVEAQPEVMEALHAGARAKTIQRSVVLSAFGKDFCEVCLPLDPAEVEALTAEH
jgi:Abortive infection alpha